MKEFTRQPTRGERAFGIALSAMLAIVLGLLSMLLVSKGAWVASAVVGVVLACVVFILCRAVLGGRSALGRKGSHRLAWALLLLGIGGCALVALVGFTHGSIEHRRMVLGGSIMLFSAGLAGIRGSHARA
ncbi:hypothetical protein [Noviluteimonas dokdonensis]|uniref:hypothetical protein n=1 Tax=Noviluteimonas dokdonensis TaxID=414050 RepID=UPI000566C7F7|nr:hypothetical protein [Lysobacter dokdonensis]